MSLYYNYKIIMLILARLVFLAFCLFVIISLFMSDFEDKKNAISYKLYLFLFIFILNFMSQIFSNLINGDKILMDEIIDTSINNGLIAVIAFGIYGDLNENGLFIQYNYNQKILVLILLIVGFITTIKVLELLITSG